MFLLKHITDLRKQALQHILVDQQAELIKELEQDVMRVVKDQNGNHVIQKILEFVPRQHTGFIIDAFQGQVDQLSKHAFGCRVIQRILDHGSEEDRTRITRELHACARDLIGDTYGNYVAQHIIENGLAEDKARFVDLVTKDVLSHARHKYASNVVETCIIKGTPEQRRSIRIAISETSRDGSSPLPQLIRDQYGNYVIRE
jgi:mRNA-binding protein PUF3